MITYGSHGKRIYNNGYEVIPLSPNTKICNVKGWSSLTLPPDYEKYYGYGIGIRCGVGAQPVYAVDLDIKDENIIAALSKEFNNRKSMYRVGNPPKRLYLFRGEAKGLRKQSSDKYEEGQVEILGCGQQFAAFGVHPKTKRPYQWFNGSPVSVPSERLPVLTLTEMNKIISFFNSMAELYGFILEKQKEKLNTKRIYERDNPLFEKQPLEISDKKLKEMVEVNDPDCDRETWRNIGFALHHQTKGSDTGYQIWDDWSGRGSKYKEGETEYQWSTFGRSNSEPITAAYIKSLYNERTIEKTENILAKEIKVNQEDPFNDLNWSIERFEKVPPKLEMIIEHMLPKGITALIYSAGGVGKSTLMLFIASRIAFTLCYPQLDFAGCSINGGSVVILTAEDPDIILNRRLVGVVTELSQETNIPADAIWQKLSGSLYIVSTFGTSMRLFGVKNDTIKPTKAFVSFLRHLKNIKNLQLVVIDTKTRYSPGEGMGNIAASNEVGYYEMIAVATQATVILLHHTTKKSRDGSLDGMQAYRDATAWFDDTRASWYFRSATEKELSIEGVDLKDKQDYFIFENSKNSYIKKQNIKIVQRRGYSFFFRDAISLENKKEAGDKKGQELLEEMVAWMQAERETVFCQADMIRWGKNFLNVGRSKILTTLNNGCEDGLIELTGGKVGQMKKYSLTEYGLCYNLQVG